MAMDVSILKNSNKCSLKLPIASHKTVREQSIRERPNLTTRELIEKLSYLTNESNIQKRLGGNLQKNDVKYKPLKVNYEKVHETLYTILVFSKPLNDITTIHI